MPILAILLIATGIILLLSFLLLIGGALLIGFLVACLERPELALAIPLTLIGLGLVLLVI